MKWNLKPLLCSCTHKLRCKVFLLVLFFFSALAANGQLTQQQVQDAVYNALTTAPLNYTGSQLNSVPWLWPGDSMTLGEYFMASFGWGAEWVPSDTLRSLLRDIAANTRTNSADFSLLLPLLSAITNSMVTATQLENELYTLSENRLAKLDYLGGYTYTDSSELRVHDDSLNELVSNMVFDAGGLGADMSSTLSQLIGISHDLEYIRGQFEAEASMPVSNIVDTARADTDDEYDVALEDALDEYDSIPLPTSEEDYRTEAADPEGPTSDDVFGNVNTSVSHSALLTLTTAPATRASSSIIPAIEIDFGRDSAFVAFCLRLNDLTDWLYPILGTLVLSLKGLSMWRVVRQASTFASASGALPNMHLAWDPF